MAERSVTIRILGDASKAKTAFSDAGQSVTTFEGKVEGLGGKLGTLATTAGGFVLGSAFAAAPGFLLDGAKAAAEGEAKMLRLKQAVENTGASYDTYGGAIDEAIKRGQDLAFADDDVADALSTLISLTGDTDEGMRRLSIAQDLARGTGMDLQTAAKLLGKTSDENTATLARYGIQLDKNATAQDVLNAVDAKFGGQAAAFAESDAGKMAKMADQTGELQEQLGSFLLPAMALVVSVASQLIGGFSTLLTWLEPVASVIGDNLTPILAGLGAALITVGAVALPGLITAAMAWVTTTAPPLIAQGIALAAAYAPITITVLAIAGAVALLAAAWEGNWFGIQDKTKAVIEWLSPYLQAAWDGIKAGVEAALSAVQVVWDTVWPYLRSAVELILPVIATVVSTYISAAQTAIETALAVIQGVWDLVWPALQVTAETVWSAIQTAVNVIDEVKSKIDTVLGEIKGIWDPIWDGIRQKVDDVWNLAEGILGLVGTGLGEIKGKIDGAYEGITSAWQTIWDTITGAVQTAKDTIIGILEGIIGAANAVISVVNGGIEAINEALTFSVTLPGVDFPGVVNAAGVPDVPETTIGYDSNIPTIPPIPNPFGGGGGGGYGYGVGPELANYVGGAPNPGQMPNAGPFVPSGPAIPTAEEQAQHLQQALNHFFGSGSSIGGGMAGGRGLVEEIKRGVREGLREALTGAM